MIDHLSVVVSDYENLAANALSPNVRAQAEAA